MDHNEIDLELNDLDNRNIEKNIAANNQNFTGYNNYNDLPAKNFEDNSNNVNNNDVVSLEQLKEKNKQINLDKIGFYKFLIYSTKAEIHINSFQDLLYWVSLLEISLYVLSILLFISSPSNFYIFWTFTIHAVRGIIGLILLFRIPNSHLAVENIENCDSSSIVALQEQLASNYIKLLQDNESRIKTLLIVYFILTIIDIIVDNIIFFYLITKWENQEYSLTNIIGLLLIVIFFLCNGVYFSWMGSIKLTFPYEMWNPIKLAIIGSLSAIKRMIYEKSSNAYVKAKNMIRRRNNNTIDEEQRDARHDNPNPDVIDR